ncbi:putative serine protease K12H4.7 [Aplysia californica]|uniref:Serine protease K12H4.7 n=1 Tax=Aplysia californica TaxID=6500 RepID=A0ABM0JFQ5_APLCA|nr:putative serine protease K12H4.7 [Aplysia californica]
MRFSLILCLLLLALFACGDAAVPIVSGFFPPPESTGAPLVPEQWFEQPLDHFDGANPRTWKQRYFTSSAHYTKGGPLFVYIGGEGRMSGPSVEGGAWVDYAKTYKAYLVVVEHRYYGMSRPTEDMSTENLQFLSSEQALADLANFLTWQRKQLGGPKIIVFGGSYAGALAAWFRYKYPHIAHGAVASSGPVLAKVDFLEYMEVVDASLRTYDGRGACNDAISNATKQIQAMIETKAGRDKLFLLFKLCDHLNLSISEDISRLFETLSTPFASAVQYNTGPPGKSSIDQVCNVMTDSRRGSYVDRLAAVVMPEPPKSPSQMCLDYKYSKYIKMMRETEWGPSVGVGMRQWIYQTCTEFGYYQTSDSSHQPFGHGFSLPYFIKQCTDIYGNQFNKTLVSRDIVRSNEDYAGLGPKMSRVVFPNGSIDPWHALGILKDIGPDAKAIFINGTSHCENMGSPSPNDSPQLKQARAEIRSSIGQWLEADTDY